MIAGIPILIVVVATGTREAFVPSLKSLIVIAYITIVPMALGNIAWFSIVDRMPASASGLSTVMVPMVAMVTGAIVRAEPLGPLQLGAMACCGASLLLALLRPQRSTTVGPWGIASPARRPSMGVSPIAPALHRP